MSEVVSKWILHRLGMIIDMTPENFAVRTSNGRLLAHILQTYEIITPEELSLIKDSEDVKVGYENFKLISMWLHYIGLTLNLDDLYKIVHAVGSTSLHLFFRVFLELKDRTKLDFLAEKEVKLQLGKQFQRFCVKTVDDNVDQTKFDLHREGLCEPFLAGGDVYHWYKDRIENFQSKCKDARDEYIHNVKNRCKSFSIERGIREIDSAFVFARGLTISPRPSQVGENPFLMLPKEDLRSIDLRTYEDLVMQQEKAQKYPTFTPDPAAAKQIMENLRTKSKVRLENRILRNQLHQQIMNSFDRKINDNKLQSADQVLTDILLKESLYEKDMVTKLGQIKMFQKYMQENKFQQEKILNKLKEKKFIDQLILKDKELNDKKLTYYFEHERLIQLHKEIWKEKLLLKQKKHQSICSEVIRDIVDISVNIAEFNKQYDRDPNKREIKEMESMYQTSQSGFDVCDNAINTINDTAYDMSEEVLTTEISKQNMLDDEEFNSYMKYEWPWELDPAVCDTDMLLQISYGLNVLGYIVHQALNIKYPIVPLWEKPDFPDCNVRVCINGLNDTSILTNLRNLLSEKELKIIELPEAVLFCIEAYTNENHRENDADPNTSGIEIKEKEKKLRIKKGEKSRKTKKTEHKGESDETLLSSTVHFDNKCVQTPLKFPCEEISFTSQALLGKTAQELLNEGRPLGNFLLVDMFIEYLKSIPNLKGWVLVNYPSTFEQAIILEEALSGTKCLNPNMKLTTDKSLSDIIDHEQNIDKDNCSLYTDAKRTSRLVPNPLLLDNIESYDTALTAYIRIKKITCDVKAENGMLSPGFENLDAEPDPLDEFYSNAGACYSLYYKEFDPSTIKYLGKLIIGDYSLPLKSSLQLFGESVNLGFQPFERQGEVKSTKKGKKEKKNKEDAVPRPATDASKETSTEVDTKRKKGKGKVMMIYESKGVQVPSEEEEELEDIVLSESTQEIPEAGEKGWEYTTMNCPEEIMITLATLWESIEEIYINDLKQLFFLKRINLAATMPFVQYVKNIMNKIIDRPDYRGHYMSKFQIAFNSFEMNDRIDRDFKTEMYCRVEDLKEKLTEMSDIKMMESENLRCRIINADWSPSQMTGLINTYINMIQIETDRSINSIQFINDYYLGSITGLPTNEDTYTEEPIAKYHGINSEVINNMFQDNESTIDLSYFEELLSSVVQKVHSCIKKLSAFAVNTMERTKSSEITNAKLLSKAGRPKSKGSKNTKQSLDLEANEIKNKYESIVKEWECAIRGETLRVTLRVDLIKDNALQAIKEFISSVQNCFHEAYQQIHLKYRNEIQDISIVCNAFHTAIENEQPIQEELLLDQYKFSVNPEILLYDNKPIIPELSAKLLEDGAFSIVQLSRLADIFLDLSPMGYMPKSSFTFILQDIIWVSDETGLQSFSPKLWRKLKPQNLINIISGIFDDQEYVYWRDFIIYNIRIPFPTEGQLLSTRKIFRECDPDNTELIQDYQFFSAKLWFEYCLEGEDTHEILDIKHLLFKLYYKKNYGVNYTALLLDFCKAENSVEGFAKALELSLGKIVCWNMDIGNKFKELHLKIVNQHEIDVNNRVQEIDEYNKAAYDEILKLVDQIVHVSEDVIIEELDPPRDNDDTSFRINPIEDVNKHLNGSMHSKPENEIFEKNNVQVSDSSNEKIDSYTGTQILEDPYKFPDNVYSERNEFADILFFISLNTIKTVITAAIPWHSRVENIQDLSYWEYVAQTFECCKNPDFGNSVLAHEFLNSNDFLKLLSLTKKFRIIDPLVLVNGIISNCDDGSQLNTSS